MNGQNKGSGSKRKQKLISRVEPDTELELELSNGGDEDDPHEKPKRPRINDIIQVQKQQFLSSTSSSTRNSINYIDPSEHSSRVNILTKKLTNRASSIKGLSIPYLPKYVTGFHAFRQQKHIKLEKAFEKWQLLSSVDRKIYNKLAERKNVVAKHSMITRANDNLEINPEELVKNDIKAVVKKTLSKGSYRFSNYRKFNDGMENDDALFVSWYFMGYAERALWPTEPITYGFNVSDELKTKVKKVVSTSTSETDKNEEVEQEEILMPVPLQKNFPDAQFEARFILVKIVESFMSLEIQSGMGIADYVDQLWGATDEFKSFFKNFNTKAEYGEYETLINLQNSLFSSIHLLRKSNTQNSHEEAEINKATCKMLSHYIKVRDTLCENGQRLSSPALDVAPQTPDEINYVKILHQVHKRYDFVYVKIAGEIDIKVARISKFLRNNTAFEGECFEPLAKFLPSTKKLTYNNTLCYVKKGKLDEFYMTDIVGKCMVLSEDEYEKGRPTYFNEKDVYVCTHVAIQRKFLRKMSSFCMQKLLRSLGKLKSEIYYFKFDGTETLVCDNEVDGEIPQETNEIESNEKIDLPETVEENDIQYSEDFHIDDSSTLSSYLEQNTNGHPEINEANDEDDDDDVALIETNQDDDDVISIHSDDPDPEPIEYQNPSSVPETFEEENDSSENIILFDDETHNIIDPKKVVFVVNQPVENELVYVIEENSSDMVDST